MKKGCSEAIDSKLMSEVKIENFSEFNKAYKQILKLKEEDFESKNENILKEGDALASLYDMLFTLKVKDEKAFNQIKQYALDYSKDETLGIYSNESSFFYSKIMPPEAFEAYKDCITKTNTAGILSFEVLSDNGSQLTVSITYRQQDPTDPEFLTISTVNMNDNLRFQSGGNILRKGDIIPEFQPILLDIERENQNRTSTLIITFKARPESINESFDPIIQSDGTPIGTVISSPFPYAQFCEINGYPQFFDKQKSKWAPCDGRSIDSECFPGQTPDLRGVFIRGLNQFLKDKDEPKLEETRKDPEDDRNPSSFQKDGFSEHAHTEFVTYYTGSTGATEGNKSGVCNYPNSPHGVYSSGVKTSYEGIEETRPKNIALYYYIKINP